MNLNATLFAQMVVFLVLAWFTMRFVWPPLTKAIEARMKKISEGLAAADQSTAELASAQQQANKIIAQARDEGRQRVADAEKNAQVAAEEIKQKAEADAARIVANAKQEANQQFVKAREALQMEVALLAVKVAEHILKREIDHRTHIEFVNQFVNVNMNRR